MSGLSSDDCLSYTSCLSSFPIIAASGTSVLTSSQTIICAAVWPKAVYLTISIQPLCACCAAWPVRSQAGHSDRLSNQGRYVLEGVELSYVACGQPPVVFWWGASEANVWRNAESNALSLAPA
jgi:hypothetical protein